MSEKTFTTAIATMDARFVDVDARFEQIDTRFEQIDTRLKQIDTHFEQIDARFVEVIEMMHMTNQKVDHLTEAVLTINRRVDGVEVRLGTLEHSVARIDTKMDDMQEDLTAALAALDTESVRGLDHEKRIRRLERVR